MKAKDSLNVLRDFSRRLRTVSFQLSDWTFGEAVSQLRQIETEFLKRAESESQSSAIRKTIATEVARLACDCGEAVDVCYSHFENAKTVGFLDLFEMVTIHILFAGVCVSMNNNEMAMGVLVEARQELCQPNCPLARKDVLNLLNDIERMCVQIAESQVGQAHRA